MVRRLVEVAHVQRGARACVRQVHLDKLLDHHGLLFRIVHQLQRALHSPLVTQYTHVKARRLLVRERCRAVRRAHVGNDDVVEVDTVQHLRNRLFEQCEEGIALRFVVVCVGLKSAADRPWHARLVLVAANQLAFAIVGNHTALVRGAFRTQRSATVDVRLLPVLKTILT